MDYISPVEVMVPNSGSARIVHQQRLVHQKLRPTVGKPIPEMDDGHDGKFVTICFLMLIECFKI